MTGVSGVGIGVSGRRSIVYRAIAAIRRNGGSAWWVPDDYGLVLGPELVTNGDFSAGATGWATTNGTLSVVSGAARVTSTSTAQDCRLFSSALSLTVGRQYVAKATILASTSPNAAKVAVGTGAGFSTVASSTGAVGASTQSVLFTATSATMYVWSSVAQDTGSYFDSDNISVREVLSAGIYTDSTGTTPVSVVGDVLGLLPDRSYGAGNLGPELVTNGGPFDSTTGWNPFNSNGSLSVVGGRLRATATSLFDSGIRATLPSSIVAGKRVAVTIDIYQSSAGRRISVGSGGELYYSPAGMPSGYSRVTFLGVQGTTKSEFYVRFAGTTEQVGDYFEIASISVREVLGNHATQATTANKPVIARVPRKLGPELVTNGDFSNGTTGWSPNGGSVTTVSGELQFTASSQYGSVVQEFATSTGKTYWLSVTARLGTSTSAFAKLRDLSGSPQTITANLTASSQVLTCVHTATSERSVVELQNLSAGLGTSFYDNVSVREVLEWSNAQKFDGSNDHLVTTQATGTTGWVSVALVADALGFMAACGSGGVSPGLDAGVAIKLRSNGSVWFRTATTSAQSEVQAAAASYSVGVPVILTMAWTPSLLQAWVNGVSVGTVASPNVGVGGSLYIGCHSSSLAEMFNGRIIDSAFGQTTLTDADRKAIERSMASRAGITYLG